MRSRTLLIAILSTLFFVPAASAQTRSNPGGDTSARLYSIRGNVRGAADEASMERIRVELRRFTGEVVNVTFTRTNGEFEFNAVSRGNYQLAIEETGYEPVRETVEITASSRFGLILYMRKLVGPGVDPDRPSGDAVSKRELALPRKVQDSLHRGMTLLYEKKNYRDSIEHFQRTINAAPDFYEAYYHIGVAHAELGDTQNAEQSFRKSIELAQKEGYPKPHFALASLLSTQNRFAEAEEAARRGLDLEEGAWQGYYELARALLGLQRTDEAEKAAATSVQRKTDFAPAYLLLANVHIRKKNYPAIVKDLDEFLRLDPDGAMSQQARQMRDQIQKKLSEAASAAPAKP